MRSHPQHAATPRPAVEARTEPRYWVTGTEDRQLISPCRLNELREESFARLVRAMGPGRCKEFAIKVRVTPSPSA